MSPLMYILWLGGILVLFIGIRYAWFLIVKNRNNAGVQRTSRFEPQGPLSQPLPGSQVHLTENDYDDAPEPTPEYVPHRFTRRELRRAFMLKTLIDEPRWKIPPHSDLKN